MKAPGKVDRYLRGEGFGYGKPYYQRLSVGLPAVELVHFGRHPGGLLLHVALAYPDQDGGPQISPMELSVVRPSGLATGVPGGHEQDAFWDAGDSDQLISGLSGHVQHHLCRIADPLLMTETLDFLMGESEFDRCVSVFPALSLPWVSRKVTAVRLTSKAAYLNLMKRFDDAKLVVERIPKSLFTPFDAKILADTSQRAIDVPNAYVAYLRGIGART